MEVNLVTNSSCGRYLSRFAAHLLYEFRQSQLPALRPDQIGKLPAPQLPFLLICDMTPSAAEAHLQVTALLDDYFLARMVQFEVFGVSGLAGLAVFGRVGIFVDGVCIAQAARPNLDMFSNLFSQYFERNHPFPVFATGAICPSLRTLRPTVYSLDPVAACCEP